MFKYYLYAAFISGILFTTPITIGVYMLEKKLKKNEAEIFYTPLVSMIIFTVIFLYALANKITYIGEFFGYGY